MPQNSLNDTNEGKQISQGNDNSKKKQKFSDSKPDITLDRNNSIVSLKDFIIEGEKSTNDTEYIKSDGVYHGEAVGGVPNGKGRYKYHNGDLYEGDFVNGKKWGQGKFTYRDGSYYQGQWENDKREGKGYEENYDGDVYQGQFINI